MTNNTRFRYSRTVFQLAAAASMTLAVVTHVAADDIDVYSSPSAEVGIPNVLFIIDNSARWGSTLPGGSTSGLICPGANGLPGALPSDEVGTKVGAEKCALYTLFYRMTDDDLRSFNFGFMLFNESKYANSSTYPRLSFSWANPSDPNYAATRRTEILTMIAGLGRTKDAADAPTTAEAFYEAYLWFKGLPVWKGDKTNYDNKNDVKAFTTSSRTTWRAPEIGCAKNHIIYLANQSPNDSGQTSEKFLKNIYPKARRIEIPPAFNVSNNDDANWSDEYAAFFNLYLDLSPALDGEQGIQVHTISVTGAPSDGNYPNYFQWVARQGGGQAVVAKSPQAILDGLLGTLNSIRASNSVFSAAALPVSANTQGAYLNQVFIGMFRPDGNALPRWVGNLKQYQFKYYSDLTDPKYGTLELADALDIPAVNPDNGFILPSAQSHWTKGSSFWTGDSAKYPDPSDLPDGAAVEKGGIGQWLRTAYSTVTARAGRPAYTCVGNCDGADLTNDTKYAFKPGNTLLTSSAFGGADKTLLINWLLGHENVLDTNVGNFTVARDQLTTPPSGSTVRPSIHGDVLHSRPIALNYAGANQPPKIYVFYGANDGMLRAINGNRTGSDAGSELWAFVAEEHFSKLNRLRENSPEVKYPSTPVGNTTAQPRSYFFDGPIGAYQNPGSGEVKIFATMRRGGRAVYAFDVKDPLKPKVMWRINETLLDYALMGQTWSTPRPTLVKGYSDPVLIMGGGYDDSEDSSSPGTLGRGVYVIDMKTGQRLAHLFVASAPGFSVPSDVSLIDTDRDGFVDRAYFVDVRANVYRIDMEYDAGSPLAGSTREPKDWAVTKVAALNDESDGVSGSRRVFFAPDVVLTKGYAALMIGTGDREKPLIASTNDRFFIIKDTKVTKGEPTPAPTAIKESDLVAVGTNGEKGCFLTFSEAALGEKVINQPITFAGKTYFSTNRPVLRSENAKACSATRSRAYEVPLICRAPPDPIALQGDGLPPSPVVGYVEVGNGKVVPFVIGGANPKKSAIEVTRPEIKIPGNRKRSYWFMQNRDR